MLDSCAGSPALCRSGRFCFVGAVTNETILLMMSPPADRTSRGITDTEAHVYDRKTNGEVFPDAMGQLLGSIEAVFQELG